MGEIDLYKSLALWNSHWTTGKVSKLIKKHEEPRRTFYHIRKRITNLPFEIMAGPRQVGKTTMMGHLMEYLMEEGYRPEEILYVPLDVPAVAAELGGGLQAVVDVYERLILKESISKVKRPVIFFLDEIHTLPDWGKELKGLYDQYHPTLRVLGTGSSSAALLNPTTADAPGRWEKNHMHPLKFLEAAGSYGIGGLEEIGKLARNARDALAGLGTSTESRNAAGEAISALYAATLPHADRLYAAFDGYLLRGGFPRVQPPATMEDSFRFFEVVMDTAISKDLKLYEKVRKPQAFRSFLVMLAKNHGGKFISAGCAKDLGVDKETPASWKAVAEELFFVHQLQRVNDSFHYVPGKADKAYLQDPGLLSFLSVSTEITELEGSGKIGNVVEGVLFDHLRRLQFNTLGHRNGTIGYFDKPEVDFIVQLPHAWLAVESKYRKRISGADRRLVQYFEGRPNVMPVVATRDKFEIRDDAWIVPAWLLCMIA
ncbi:MAG: hypothetical protein CVT63_08190 [Candidatus Anoxymicrobium japonicum]|uniref:Uncharacterized protein n=1 Tax=Candidatus Anoxymicrobium japonicum TaxID=2013648 RepID=A0A2N3G3U2_9ACTN|nr:MAG: hypothetical protein CVT63_08190 [Candidatus Anoxymicrobium japonicum]